MPALLTCSRQFILVGKYCIVLPCVICNGRSGKCFHWPMFYVILLGFKRILCSISTMPTTWWTFIYYVSTNFQNILTSYPLCKHKNITESMQKSSSSDSLPLLLSLTVHCECLKAITGSLQGFLWWGNPVIFSDCGEFL